jgi:ankyrin repeat protein
MKSMHPARFLANLDSSDKIMQIFLVRLAILALITLACCSQGCRSQFFDINGPLFKAIDSGDLGEVKALLKTNPKLVSSRDNHGCTPLHLAAHRGNSDVAELLLARGANVNARDIDGDMPLFYATVANRKSMVELLLTKGANVNAKTQYLRQTSLHVAAGSGYTDIAALLLANKVDVNARDKNGMTALYWALEDVQGADTIHNPNVKEMVELLIDNKADVNIGNNYNISPLHKAVVNGDMSIVELLLAKGADVNAKDKYGNTPLHLVKKNDFVMVELLRQHGGHE